MAAGRAKSSSSSLSQPQHLASQPQHGQVLVEEAIRFPKGSKDLVDAFCHGALWLEGRYWKAQGIQPVVIPLLVSR